LHSILDAEAQTVLPIRLMAIMTEYAVTVPEDMMAIHTLTMDAKVFPFHRVLHSFYDVHQAYHQFKD
jgi:hypothetical protein